MKLAFNGKAHYTDFEDGYALYKSRSRGGKCVDYEIYKRIVRHYCGRLADKLLKEGIVDLPNEFGSIAAVMMTRKPQYRGKKFVGYGKMDWKKGHYDGKLKTFGMVYLPRRNQTGNLRSFGYVANRQLFKRMKKMFENGESNWKPLEFNDEMV